MSERDKQAAFLAAAYGRKPDEAVTVTSIEIMREAGDVEGLATAAGLLRDKLKTGTRLLIDAMCAIEQMQGDLDQALAREATLQETLTRMLDAQPAGGEEAKGWRRKAKS